MGSGQKTGACSRRGQHGKRALLALRGEIGKTSPRSSSLMPQAAMCSRPFSVFAMLSQNLGRQFRAKLHLPLPSRDLQPPWRGVQEVATAVTVKQVRLRENHRLDVGGVWGRWTRSLLR